MGEGRAVITLIRGDSGVLVRGQRTSYFHQSVTGQHDVFSREKFLVTISETIAFKYVKMRMRTSFVFYDHFFSHLVRFNLHTKRAYMRLYTYVRKANVLRCSVFYLVLWI